VAAAAPANIQCRELREVFFWFVMMVLLNERLARRCDSSVLRDRCATASAS